MDEREKRELGLAHYRDYGREEVLLDGYPAYAPCYDIQRASEVYGVPVHELQAVYEQSRRQAAQEKKDNPALFYAKALHASMGIEGSEWYGDDFDQPRWIVEQIIRLVEEKEEVQ